MTRTYTPTRQRMDGFRTVPPYHDRLETTELSTWVMPRDPSYVEVGFVDLEES